MGMEITESQYKRIAPFLPVQRGNVKISNRQILNAILFVLENGCKWRALPAEYGRWHTVYMRMNRWSKSGVLADVFRELHKELSPGLDLGVLSLDSTSVKVHPDATGAPEKMANKRSAGHGEG